jgi:hypothetical protein
MIVKTRKFNNRSVSRLIRDATTFYLHSIIPEKKHKKLNVVVKLTTNHFSDGSCYYANNNTYEIELGSHISLTHKLLTLAHECVHVKQYVTKQLKSFYVGQHAVDVWEGKRYRNLHYDDQPWEKEALDQEEELFYNFISDCYANGRLDLENLKNL